MRYGSVCSGIEAATSAWHPLGWEPAWFCEIEPFPSAVLAHRYPGVPNYGDFTALLDPSHPVHHDPAGPLDVLVGGTPCQDFSVAGLRAGIGGGRGGLTLDFCRLVDVLRPRWVVWENVPGVLSSDGGRALGAFLGALAELGYGFAWRVLDAQYFGLAQRRKRVFVVGCAGGESSRAGAVLLEPEGVRRNARKEAPADAGGRAAEPGGAVAFNGYQRTVGEIATPLMAEDYKKVEIGVLVPRVAFGCDLSQKAEGIAFSEEFQPCIAGHDKHPGHGSHVLSIEDRSPTLRATPHANTWANGGGHVGIVNIEHGLNDTRGEERGVGLDGGVGGVAPGVCFKASHFTRGKDGAPSEVDPPLSADADRGDQDTLVFTGDGVVADPISANEGKTYSHEGSNNFRMHNCVSQPPTLAFKSGQSAASWGGCATTEEFSPTLQAQNNGSTAVPAVLAFDTTQITSPLNYSSPRVVDPCRPLAAGAHPPAILHGAATSVRRLTPRECERLQGFPDDWTLIPIGKGESSDSNRYRALGNSMAVPVMRWIGERIALVDGVSARAPAPAPARAPARAVWLLNWSGRQEQD